MKTRKIEWVDIAKGIAILAVIAGHLGCRSINRVVFPWYLPVFFIVAGFFLSNKESGKEFAQKKFKRLILPFLYTSIAVILAKIFLAWISGSDMIMTAHDYVLASLWGSGSNGNILPKGVLSIGAIWFLEALFWGVFVARVCIYKCGIVRGGVLVCSIAIIAVISSRFLYIPLNLQSGCLAALLIVVGYILYNRMNILHTVNWPCLAIGALSLIVMVLIYPDFSIVRCACNPLTLLASVFISYTVFCLSMILARSKYIKTILMFFGANSLLILCLHLFELDCMPWGSILHRVPFLGWESLPRSMSLLVLFSLKIAFVSIGVVMIRRLKQMNITINKKILKYVRKHL